MEKFEQNASLKPQKIYRTPAFYWRGYGSKKQKKVAYALMNINILIVALGILFTFLYFFIPFEPFTKLEILKLEEQNGNILQETDDSIFLDIA